MKARLKLPCLRLLTAQQLVLKQPKLCNIFIFGMAYSSRKFRLKAVWKTYSVRLIQGDNHTFIVVNYYINSIVWSDTIRSLFQNQILHKIPFYVL